MNSPSMFVEFSTSARSYMTLGPTVYQVNGRALAFTFDPEVIVDVSYYLSTDRDVDTTDIYLGLQQLTFGGGNGFQQNISYIVTLPAGMPSGNYYIGMGINADHGFSEGNYINNWSTFDVVEYVNPTGVVTNAADLIVSSADLAVDDTNGDNRQLTYKFTVTNQGSQYAQPSATSVSLTDGVRGSTLSRLAEIDVPKLAPGATFSDSITFTLSDNIPPGVHTVTQIVDEHNEVVETNEDNNRSVSQSINVEQLPNFTLSLAPVAGPLFPGSTLEGDFSFANSSLVPSDAVSVEIILSRDRNVDEADIVLQKIDYGPLGAQEAVASRFSSVVSGDLESGTYYIGYRIDRDNAVAESVETDNESLQDSTQWRAIRVEPTPLPDLTARFGEARTEVRVGDTVSSHLDVRNISALATEGFTVQLVLSRDLAFDATDTVLQEVTLEGTTPGQTITVPYELNTAGLDQETSYYVGYRIDTGNAVSEAFESNNTSTASQTTWHEIFVAEPPPFIAMSFGNSMISASTWEDEHVDLTPTTVRQYQTAFATPRMMVTDLTATVDLGRTQYELQDFDLFDYYYADTAIEYDHFDAVQNRRFDNAADNTVSVVTKSLPLALEVDMRVNMDVSAPGYEIYIPTWRSIDPNSGASVEDGYYTSTELFSGQYFTNLTKNFDPVSYALLNPDLRGLSRADLESHFINFGINEGRSYQAVNFLDYALMNDLPVHSFEEWQSNRYYLAIGNPQHREQDGGLLFSYIDYIFTPTLWGDSEINRGEWQTYSLEAVADHYLAFGSNDRLPDSQIEYILLNPDLKGIYDEEGLTERYGVSFASYYPSIKATEAATTFIKPEGVYRAAYVNGVSRYLIDPNEPILGVAADHYTNFGRDEGRPTSFDAAGYFLANPDLETAGIYDYHDLFQHYQAFGRFEGRGFFDPIPFLKQYPDVLGDEYEAYYLHTRGYIDLDA